MKSPTTQEGLQTKNYKQPQLLQSILCKGTNQRHHQQGNPPILNRQNI